MLLETPSTFDEIIGFGICRTDSIHGLNLCRMTP